MGRPPELVHNTVGHPPPNTGPPIHELVVCVGSIRVLKAATISQDCQEANTVHTEIRPQISDFLEGEGAPIIRTLRHSLDPSPEATSRRSLTTFASLPFLRYHFDAMCVHGRSTREAIRLGTYHHPIITHMNVHSCVTPLDAMYTRHVHRRKDVTVSDSFVSCLCLKSSLYLLLLPARDQYKAPLQ